MTAPQTNEIRNGVRFRNAALCAAFGALSAMSFIVSGENYQGISDPPASSASYLWCALALCFALLYHTVYGRRKLRPAPSNGVFALIFGVVNAFGVWLYSYDSWAALKNPLTLGLVCLQAVGQSLPMLAGFTWLHDWMQKTFAALPAVEEAPAKARWYCRHPVLGSMAALLVCWSPFLIAFFPGSVCWDLGEMAAQYFGLRQINTWHPVFLTGLYGALLSFGRLFSSDNLGTALYMLLQTLALSYAFARTMELLRRWGLPRWFRLAALGFFGLTPIFGGYAQSICKDTFYTAFLLLFALNAMEVLAGREQGKSPSPAALAGLFGWGLLSCLVRSNGLYVVLPSGLLLLAVGAKGKARLPLAASLGGCVACALLVSNVLIPALGIPDETASGIYSVCFQQSARVLRDHGDTVTPEEYAEIDRVLDAEKLPELYETNISDPVKFTFRYSGQGAAVEKEALKRYAQTWKKMAAEYPLSYAEAFFGGSTGYYAFIPKMEGPSYNNQAGNRLMFETYTLGDDPGYVHTRQIGFLSKVRTLLAAYAKGWRRIPLLSLLYCCATYTWLLVGVGLYLVRRGQWRRLAAFLPALLSLGVCMLSPVNDYFRYFLPIVAMAFPLTGFALRPKEN